MLEFSFNREKYAILPWREGIEIKNLNSSESKYIIGIDFNNDGSISALNGDIYNLDRLCGLIKKMLQNNTLDWTKYEWEDAEVIFHDIPCVVTSRYDKNQHYRLIAMGGTLEQLKNDKSFTKYHKWVAIATPIYCHSCKNVFWIDDTDIPNGTKYDILCPNCNTMLMKKKI